MQSLVKLISDKDNSWYDDCRTSEIELSDQMIKISLTEAVNWMEKEYGNDVDKWTLGHIQTVSLKHQILGDIPYLKELFNSRGNYPFTGSQISVASAYSYSSPPGRINVTFASSQRNIYDIGNWDDSWSVNSTGASGHIFNLIGRIK